ncbi:MAG TPA: hypothetical protein V6D00_13045 [Pantanalinema sp.]
MPTIRGAAICLLLASLAACGGGPTTPPDALLAKGGSSPVTAAPPADRWNADCRYIAFTACRERPGRSTGSLLLWDAVLGDVWILSGALAGLGPLVKEVDSPLDCDALEQLNPYAFAKDRIVFTFGTAIFVYDLVNEVRIVAATDGRPPDRGGPRATLTADGKFVAYINQRGIIVLKPSDPIFATKARELGKIAAEGDALGAVIQDFDLSGDGRWVVANIDGRLYLYDVLLPHLSELLPLSGEALAGASDRIGHVAISFDGRWVAFSLNRRPVDAQLLPGSTDTRLLVLDRLSGMLDAVPYPNLGASVGSGAFPVRILDPIFCPDGQGLIFETRVGHDFRVWKYDLLTEQLRGLVILNDALGAAGDDTLLSGPGLVP